MATIRHIEKNITANVRDSGKITNYIVRVSVDGKDKRVTFITLDEAREWRDERLSDQYKAQQSDRQVKGNPVLNGWGWI